MKGKNYKSVDNQLYTNDCGVSAVKTIYNICGFDLDRNYIKNQLPLHEQGAQFKDIKTFFEKHNFEASFKLIDLDSSIENINYLNSLTPFILTKKSRNTLHYVVVNKFVNKKVEIFDPAVTTPYKISISDLKQIIYYNESFIDYVDINERIESLVNHELKEYGIESNYTQETYVSLFNKLTYFTYVKDSFGFKDKEAEKGFLIDLIKNLDISTIPKQFRTLKYNNEKVKIKAPLVLSVKPKELKSQVTLPSSENTNIYWQLFKQLGQYQKLWGIYIFAALFSAITAQLAVFINQILIDDILPSYNLGTLSLFAIGLGVYKLFDLFTSIYKSFVGLHLGNMLDRYFLNSFDEKLNKFSLPYILTFKKGDLIERVSDSLKLKAFFQRFFTTILVDTFVAIYSLGILFFINWQISLIVLFVMILFYGWFKFITPYLKQNERIRYIRKADFLSRIIEKIEGIQVIKSFQIEFFQSQKIQQSVNQFLQIQLKNGYVSLLNNVVVSFIVIVSSLLIIVFLTRTAILEQVITLGQIVTFIALSTRVFSSLSNILNENLTLQENEVILRRSMDFEESGEVELRNTGIDQFEFETLEIKKLKFGYFKDEMILNDINLAVKKGEKIKIEGQNGSGKSTLSKILTALYVPSEGDILINDIPSNLYRHNSLKDKIILVSNEDQLFNDSIINNICLGKDVNERKIIQLAKQIDLYDYIVAKDEGLDYIINENGKNLSTGQRKKILLMRALLSSADILILDEVLSGMDVESRNKVETLIQQMNDKAFIIISHEPITNISFTNKYKISNGELNAF